MQQHRPRDYLKNYLKWQTAVLKPSLCTFTLLSPQSDHTHQITRLSTEQKLAFFLICGNDEGPNRPHKIYCLFLVHHLTSEVVLPTF